MSDHPSTLRDGRYAVIGVLGEGTQAQTLSAVDKREGRSVAIKRFVVRGARSWKDVELAEREARVLSNLTHPNLPAYVEHFEENGELYLVMEQVAGESLQQIKKRGARLDRDQVRRLLVEIADVLDYLHHQAPPIIHRDVKPGNVILRPDGGFTLVDFGSVRDRLKAEGGSTVVGTFGYMAPEQFQGRALPQTDVYALGATALSVLTGQEPENLPHQGLRLDVARALPGDPTLGSVLARLVEPDPDQRPADIRPLLRELHVSGARHSRPAAAQQPFSAAGARVGRRDRAGAHDLGSAVGEPLPRVVLLICILGLRIAQIAVRLSVGVFVPLLLTILSLVFGTGLRRAAHSVRSASYRADDALWRARRAVRRLKFVPEPERVHHAGPQRVRVESEARSRQRGPRVVETTSEDLEDYRSESEHLEAERAARRENR